MSAIIKILFLVSFFFSFYTSLGQNTLSSLISVPLGNPYEQDAALRKKLIKQKYVLYYNKDENKYLLEFENVSIDNYGNADVEFTYIRNSLAIVHLYFRSDCNAYASLVQIYKELDLNIKQKYYGVIDKMGYEWEYDLWSKNIYDSAKKIFNLFRENKQLCKDRSGYRSSWDDYKLGKSSFKDNRIISLFISLGDISEIRKYYSQPITDTVCQEFLSLSIYNTKTMELIRATPSLSLGSEIERRENTINLKTQGGVYLLKAKLNGILDNQEFIFDTGASDVTITPDVFLVLYRSGTIKDSDFIGSGTYKLADGSYVKSSRFILSEMKIGDIVLNDIEVSISNSIQAPMLFGQSAISKLGKYKIDFKEGLLILER